MVPTLAAVVCLAALVGCASPNCRGETVPTRLWLRADRPGQAWPSPASTQPLPCIHVVRLPILSSGGAEVDFGQDAMVECEGRLEAGGTREPMTRSRYRVIARRTDAEGVLWTEFERE
jgi:hypothetical protein